MKMIHSEQDRTSELGVVSSNELGWSGEYVGREHFLAFNETVPGTYISNTVSRIFNSIVSSALGRTQLSVDIDPSGHGFKVVPRTNAGMEAFRLSVDQRHYSKMSSASRIYAEYVVDTVDIMPFIRLTINPRTQKARHFLAEFGRYIITKQES